MLTACGASVQKREKRDEPQSLRKPRMMWVRSSRAPTRPAPQQRKQLLSTHDRIAVVRLRRAVKNKQRIRGPLVRT